MYMIIWEFQVKEEFKAEFIEAYGAAGLWAALFRRGEGFLGTRLFHDTADPQRYLTIDQWISAAAHDAFKEQWTAEYEAIDRRCARLTKQESLLGDFKIGL